MSFNLYTAQFRIGKFITTDKGKGYFILPPSGLTKMMLGKATSHPFLQLIIQLTGIVTT